MNKERKLKVTVAQALAKPKDEHIENVVQNCTTIESATKVVESEDVLSADNIHVPMGQYLYGIKLKDGRYMRIVAETLLAAIHKLGVKLEDVKRGMSIKAGPKKEQTYGN